MRTGMILVAVLVLLLTALTAAALYRFMMLRRGGTAALLRTLPAEAGHGWRHGLIRYGESSLVFFKLTSLKIGADIRIDRHSIFLGNRRGPRGDEYDIMTDEIIVAGVEDEETGRRYEMALDRGSMSALLSWYESRPSGRSVRGPF